MKMPGWKARSQMLFVLAWQYKSGEGLKKEQHGLVNPWVVLFSKNRDPRYNRFSRRCFYL